MNDALQVALAVALLVLPGAVLLRVCGLRGDGRRDDGHGRRDGARTARWWWGAWPLTLGAAPAVTAGVVLLAALVQGVTGLRFGPPLVLGVFLVLVALAAVVRVLATPRRRDEDPDAGDAAATAGDAPATGADTAPARARRPLAVDVAGWSLLAVAVAVALRTYHRGLGTLAVVPQEHDTIHHTSVVAYIWRTGRAAPWQIFPADVVTGAPVGYYPAGSQSIAALLTPLTGDPVSGLNAMMVAVLAVGGLLAVHALACQLPHRWAPVVGGFAALLAATSYRPTIAFLHDGGVLANACAMALVPGLVALALALPGRRWPVVLPLALAAGGLLTVHPTSGPVAAAGVLAWWVGQALFGGRSGVRSLGFTRHSWLPLVLTGGLAAALAAPTVLSASASGGAVSEWPRDMPVLTFGEAFPIAAGQPYGGFLDVDFLLDQRAAALLALAGAVIALATRRGGGAVAAWVGFKLVVLIYLLTPDAPLVSTFTGLFYNSYVRIQSAGAAWAWVLGGVALAAPTALVVQLLARRAERAGHALRTLPLVAATALVAVASLGAFWVVAGQQYAAVNAQAIGARYATPDFVRVDADDRAAFTYLADHVEPGQRVLNNANDGSTYAYTYDGIDVVNFTPLGDAELLYGWGLLAAVDEAATDTQVQDWLCEEDVAWVYVDTSAPGIGAFQTPGDWYPDRTTYTVPPAFQDLATTPGFTAEFTSGPVTVYSVAEDLRDSCTAPAA